MVEQTRNRSLADTAVAFTGLCLGAFILVPFRAKPYLVVLLFLVAALDRLRNRAGTVDFRKVLALSLFFVVYLYSMVYTAQPGTGIKILSRIVPIVVIPLSFSLFDERSRSRFKVFFRPTFAGACAVYVVMILLYFWQLGYFSGRRNLLVCYSFVTNEFYGFNDHPIYLSIYFSVALLMLLDGAVKQRLVTAVLFLTVMGGLLLLARKGVILAFLLSTGFMAMKAMSKRQRIGILTLVAGLFALSLLHPEIRQRFTELSDTSNITVSTETSSGVRFTIWKTAVGLVGNAPVFGYGVGDVQHTLDDRLVETGYQMLLPGHYNAHNQYLQIALSAGIVGLSIFLLGLFYCLWERIGQGDFVAASMLLFFLITFFFESLLERQNGVILFSIIASIFLIRPPQIATPS